MATLSVVALAMASLAAVGSAEAGEDIGWGAKSNEGNYASEVAPTAITLYKAKINASDEPNYIKTVEEMCKLGSTRCLSYRSIISKKKKTVLNRRSMSLCSFLQMSE